jgi:putative MATE family efflux protein
MPQGALAASAAAHASRRATLVAVLGLAGPAIGQSLLETLVFLVDRAMLGRHSAASLASMQISGPLTWSVLSVMGAFAVGVVALVGRATGAGDRALAGAAVRAGLVLAALVGSLAGVLVTVGMPLILAAFPGASPEVHEAARAYLTMLAPGMPLLLVVGVAAAALQAAGDTRTPFYIAAIGNLVNAVAAWALIFGHLGASSMGTRGAALASVLAMLVQVVLLLAALARRDGRVSLRGRGGEREAALRFLRVSMPSFAEKIVQHLGFFVFVTMIGALGSTAMAANQTLVSLESVCFLSADGFGIAAASIVAQRLGARRPEDAAYAARVATSLAVVSLGSVGVLFAVAPHVLLRLFTSDAPILAAAAPVMLVAAISQPFMAMGVVLSQAVRGAGDTRSALVVTLVGGLVVRLAATYYFTQVAGLGLYGVWLGSTCDWIVRTGLLAAVWARGGWKRAAV